MTVGYVYMTAYPLTKYDYIMERVCFIYRLFIFLSVHCHSCCFYIQYHRGRCKRDYLHASIDILFLSSMLLTLWKNIRHFYTMSVLTIQKRSRFEPGPLSPSTPLYQCLFFTLQLTYLSLTWMCCNREDNTKINSI